MKSLRFMLRSTLLALALPLLCTALHANSIEMSILNPNQIGFAGDVITFQGTITNNSGVDLDSTDFFLDFFGYDAANVTLDQVLGETFFTVANGTTSPLEDLFTFTLASTAGPGLYPAQVVLQDSVGDISDTYNVSVSIVPEPSSLALLGTGLLGLLPAIRRRIKYVLPALLMAVVVSQVGSAQVSAVKLVTTTPGLGLANGSLAVAANISNLGTVTATNIQVTSATLKGLTATHISPTTLGTLAPGQTAVVQANFNSATLVANTPYLLTIRGTYKVGSATAGFSVNRFMQVPPNSPGSNTTGTGSMTGIFVTGAPYKHHDPEQDDDVNLPRPPIPTGPFVSGTTTPTGTSFQAFPSGKQNAKSLTGSQVVFDLNSSLGNSGAGTNCNPGTAPSSCAEPSGASNRQGIVFATANWSAAYSTDGGQTFTQLDPTTIFPNDTIGYCCDQVVQYVPSIDRFIWVLQGPGGYRLAAASPQDVVSSKGTSWTYWNLGPTTFGQPTGTGFDYPDTSVGDNNFYLSWDMGAFNCPSGCTSGREVMSIPLSQIQAAGTIFFGYTHPADASLAWGSHLTQDTGNEIFWAGHNQNNALRVFSWVEGSNTYFWRDITVSTWANGTLSAPTPDGNDWFKFGFPGNSIIGSTRSGNQLWFAWTAATDKNFSQDHIEMATLDRGNNFNKIRQVQIWNSGFAFGYPALATNQCTGEIGLSLTLGGGGNYENHAVGFWGDFVVYTTTNSSSGVNRYGDYMTIRQDNFDTFSAMGYGTSTVKGNMQSDVRYVVFGRNCDSKK